MPTFPWWWDDAENGGYYDSYNDEKASLASWMREYESGAMEAGYVFRESTSILKDDARLKWAIHASETGTNSSCPQTGDNLEDGEA